MTDNFWGKMNKLYFKDISGKKQWIDLSLVSVVQICERDQIYRIQFCDANLYPLGSYMISLETKNSVSEELNNYFNAKATLWDHE